MFCGLCLLLSGCYLLHIFLFAYFVGVDSYRLHFCHFLDDPLSPILMNVISQEHFFKFQLKDDINWFCCSEVKGQGGLDDLFIYYYFFVNHTHKLGWLNRSSRLNICVKNPCFRMCSFFAAKVIFKGLLLHHVTTLSISRYLSVLPEKRDYVIASFNA